MLPLMLQLVPCSLVKTWLTVNSMPFSLDVKSYASAYASACALFFSENLAYSQFYATREQQFEDLNRFSKI